MTKTSIRMTDVSSDVRGPLYYKALEMEKQGKKILKLNTGNPATFGFEMPDSIREALAGGLDRAVAYCDFRGMPEAREAICAYHEAAGIKGISPDDIYIGNGVSELVTMTLLCTLDAGDELLMPSPCYSLWSNSALIANAKPVYYTCRQENDWIPTLEEIESKITPKTRGIVLINPNNPTGAVYPRETVEGIVALAEKYDLVIHSDEIYDRLLIGDVVHTPAATVESSVPVFTYGGLSKSHYLCGFRCGWMVVSGPRARTAPLHEVLIKFASLRLCSNAPAQLVIPAAIADPYTIKKALSPGGRLYEQSRACIEEVEKIDGLSAVPNHAAFYLFPRIDRTKYRVENDKAFAADLLEKKQILLVPGSGFGWPEPDHFRIVMLPEAEVLRKAIRDIGDLLQDYRV